MNAIQSAGQTFLPDLTKDGDLIVFLKYYDRTAFCMQLFARIVNSL